MHKPLAVGIVLATLITLVGCTSTVDTPVPPSAAPTTAPSVLDPALVPVALSAATVDVATAEATRLGDAVQNIIDPAVIINVSDASQLVPAEGETSAYYAIYRTYTVDPSVDPLNLAGVLVSALVQSGWQLHESNTQDQVYIAGLSAGTLADPWVFLVGGDASVAGQSVVTIQIASPNLVS